MSLRSAGLYNRVPGQSELHREALFSKEEERKKGREEGRKGEREEGRKEGREGGRKEDYFKTHILRILL